MNQEKNGFPRSAWIEISLGRLRRNFEIIGRGKSPSVGVLSVVKDSAYGHGSRVVAQAALDAGASFLGVSTIEEAMELRDAGIRARILLLGERDETELDWCVAHDLTCCVADARIVDALGRLACAAGRRVPVHLKLNTGMNRYGVRWNQAADLASRIVETPGLILEGALSHLAQSDEADKTFANLQWSRFKDALEAMKSRRIEVGLRHLGNSGAFLDLPHAHFEMVRLGILPLGVYPSTACRRLAGIEPVLSVKARIAAIQSLEAGDTVGYGMRYTAPGPRRIAVLPIGYGDGFPRMRNQGCVLIRGRRAPLVGGVAMDAITVDVTEIPGASVRDEAVIQGAQDGEEITVHEVARWKNSVSYDVLAGWRARLPRIHVP